jgi:hypothetical protein
MDYNQYLAQTILRDFLKANPPGRNSKGEMYNPETEDWDIRGKGSGLVKQAPAPISPLWKMLPDFLGPLLERYKQMQIEPAANQKRG